MLKDFLKPVSSSTESYRARCYAASNLAFCNSHPPYCKFSTCTIEPLISILISVDIFRQPFRWAEHNLHFSRDIYDIPLWSFPPCWRFPFFEKCPKSPYFKHFTFVDEANCLYQRCRQYAVHLRLVRVSFPRHTVYQDPPPVHYLKHSSDKIVADTGLFAVYENLEMDEVPVLR